MAALPKHATLTKQGEDWLTMALDPFHDYQVPIAGLPDRTNIPTAVQMIKRKITITAPPNLTGTQKWDCHIFSLPLLTSYRAQSSNGDTVTENVECEADSPLCTIGNINVVRMESGNPTYVQDSFATWNDTSTVVEAYSPTDGNKDSMIRLIGGGFEVHNDTASLYKDGSVTTYSSTNDWSEPYLAYSGTGTGSETKLVVGKRCRYPPVHTTDAALYTDARTWEAAQGAYVPLRLDLDCPSVRFRPRSICMPIVADRESGTPDATSGKMIAFGKAVDVFNVTDSVPLAGHQTIWVANGNATSEFQSNGWLEAPIETTGAFFSGLSQETVLTLDIRWFTELAPTYANAAMLSMCSPSAHYDPRALECYTNCLLTLPPGVPVGMNEKGDFWRMAVKAAKQATSIAAPFLATLGPEAVALTAAAETGLEVADHVLNRKKKTHPKPAPRRVVKATGNNTLRK